MELSTPKIMGILNITPDSFYAKSRVKNEKDLLGTAHKMVSEGADFIDIGGYSSRPGAQNISEEQEIERVIFAVQLLRKEFPKTLISIDTFRAKIAEKTLDLGADLINDISGGNLDSKMLEVIASYGVPYILMHMRGTPQNMKEYANYSNVTVELIKELSQKRQKAIGAGIKDIIIDPGFGFAKTVEQNFELLKNLKQLSILECPLLIGISRKSMIHKTLNITAEDALNGTSVLNTIALMNGAKILRVHDVKEAKECVKLVEKIRY